MLFWHIARRRCSPAGLSIDPEEKTRGSRKAVTAFEGDAVRINSRLPFSESDLLYRVGGSSTVW